MRLACVITDRRPEQEETFKKGQRSQGRPKTKVTFNRGEVKQKIACITSRDDDCALSSFLTKI